MTPHGVQVLNNTIPAVGKHEVVVESPDHNGTLALGPTARVERILRAWRERGTVLSEERLVQHIMYFKNNGGGAGASLVHPHCQIVALPIVPDNVLSRTRYAHSFYEKHGVSAFKQMAREDASALPSSDLDPNLDHIWPGRSWI